MKRTQFKKDSYFFVMMRELRMVGEWKYHNAFVQTFRLKDLPLSGFKYYTIGNMLFDCSGMQIINY